MRSEGVDFARRNDAVGDGLEHALRDAGLGGTPGERGVPVAADVGLVHEQRRRLHGHVRPQDGDERNVTLPRGREGGRPGGLDRPALAAEHRVHVCRARPAAGEALADERPLGERQKAITPRATSPAFIAAKASLISSSPYVRETRASRSSRPSR